MGRNNKPKPKTTLPKQNGVAPRSAGSIQHPTGTLIKYVPVKSKGLLVNSLSVAGDSRRKDRFPAKTNKQKEHDRVRVPESFRFKDKESRIALREEQGVANSMLRLSEDLQKSSSPKEQAKLARAPQAVQQEQRAWWQDVGDFLLKAAPIILEVVAMLV